MTDRETLKRIVEKSAVRCLPSSTQPLHINMLVRELIANGVVVREKGEWELVEFQSSPLDTDQALVCSCCGFAHQYDAWFNFCPNCGADMRIEEQNRAREGENDGVLV